MIEITLLVFKSEESAISQRSLPFCSLLRFHVVFGHLPLAFDQEVDELNLLFLPLDSSELSLTDLFLALDELLLSFLRIANDLS